MPEDKLISEDKLTPEEELCQLGSKYKGNSDFAILLLSESNNKESEWKSYENAGGERNLK